jgi:hypothetical protein
VPEIIELEEQLSTLGRELEWPSTPNLAPAVAARIKVPLRRPWYQSRWALAAAVIVLAAGALLAYPNSRDSIAGWLNLHTRIERLPQVSTPTPQPPGPLGKRLGLGGRTTLTDARSKVTWPVLVPASLGQPDEVYLQPAPDGPPQGEVTLVYAARAGFTTSGQTGVAVLITEARGAVDSNFFGKMIGPGTTLEEVTVGSHHGYWIAGAPNVFFFLDANGNIRNETVRLAANTLLIDYDGTVVRVEGDLTKAQALDLAASLS